MTIKSGRAKLAAQAKTVEHVLNTAHFYVDSLWDGMDFSYNVNWARFDNGMSTVLPDTMAPISDLLITADILASDISKLVLAGSSTNVNKVSHVPPGGDVEHLD